MILVPTETVAAARIVEAAEASSPDAQIRLKVEGETLEGDFVSKVVMLPLGEPAGGTERLSNAGIEIRTEEDKVLIDNLVFGSPAESAGLDFDWEITAIVVDADRPPKELMFIPAIALLGLVVLLQRGRRERTAPVAA